MIFRSLIFYLFFVTSIFSFIDYSFTSNLITLRSPLLPRLEIKENFFRISVSSKNIWSLQYERYIIDGEEWEVKGTWNQRIKRNWSFGLEVPYKIQGGGIFDSFIEAFHRTTGTTQQHREKFPKNKLQVSYEPYGFLYQMYDQTVFTKEMRRSYPRSYPRKPQEPPPFLPLNIFSYFNGSYFIINNLVLPLEIIERKAKDFSALDNPKFYIQNFVFESGTYRGIGGIQIKIPFVNKTDYFYFGGWDVSIFFSNSYLFKKDFEFLWGVSYTSYEFKKYREIRMSNHQWSIRLHINYYKNFIYFFEYLFLSKPILNMGRLSEDGHFFSLGIQKYYKDSLFIVSLIENFYFYATSPDVGLHLSYQYFFN
ncbi:MAG: DUF3187 family protein [Leptonema sp. (in: bacteria)]